MKFEKQFERLRRQAENIVDESGSNEAECLRRNFDEVLHELQIHQAELEIQNEELRSAQTALTRARNRYERLFHQAPVGYALLDRDGVVRDVNNTLCEMLGYTHADMVGKGITVFLADGDRNVFLGRYKAFFNQPGNKGLELRLQPAKGRPLNMRLEGSRLEESTAECECRSVGSLMVSFSDITERVRAERQKSVAMQELQELTNTFVAMLDHTTDFLYFKDAGHRFTAVSQSMAELTGHAHWRDMLGKTDQDVFPEEHAVEYLKTERPVITEGKSLLGVQEAYMRSDGEIGWVSSNKWPLLDDDGNIIGLFGMSRDITDLVLIEKELKRKVGEFESIFDSSALVTIYLKGDRRMHRVNKRFERMFGYTEDEVTGKHVSLLHVTPDDARRFEREHYEALKNGRVRQVEYPLKTKEGHRIWCSLSGKAVNPPALEEGVIWVVDDISERKELEQLKADVDRMMIHDLRSPLSGIIGLPQAMQQDENLTREQKELLHTIEQAGYRMLTQVNLSLDLYKMETGQYVYQPKSVDMCRVLKRVAADLASLAHVRGVRIRIAINGTDLASASNHMVTADELLINTLMSNLVANAVEASPFGSAVDVMLFTNERHHALAVHNLGTVPEEVRDDFFGKYVTHGKEKGTGLGTYSARLMSEAMDGDITMTTGEQSGTTVTFRLPK